MKKKQTEFTAEELVEDLKRRRGGKTLEEFSGEIGLSLSMLSDVLSGRRSVANPKILEFLAPPKSHFERREKFLLVRD